MLACTGQNRFWVLLTLISILSCLLILAPFVNLSVDTFPGYGDSLRFVSFSLCSHLIVNTFIKLQILSSLVSASPALGGSAEPCKAIGACWRTQVRISVLALYIYFFCIKKDDRNFIRSSSFLLKLILLPVLRSFSAVQQSDPATGLPGSTVRIRWCCFH